MTSEKICGRCKYYENGGCVKGHKRKITLKRYKYFVPRFDPKNNTKIEKIPRETDMFVAVPLKYRFDMEEIFYKKKVDVEYVTEPVCDGEFKERD